MVINLVPRDDARCYICMLVVNSLMILIYSLMFCMAELAVGNIVRRVLHIIREEDLTLVTKDIGGLNIAAVSDDEDELDHNADNSGLSAAAVAAASRSTLRAPALHTLLEDVNESGAAARTSSSEAGSEGKSRCNLNTFLKCSFSKLTAIALHCGLLISVG